MSFTATCPHCGTEQRLSNESRGKQVACGECGERYPARPAARKKSGNSTVTYVVLGSLAFLVLGAGILLLVLVMRKSPGVPVAAPAPTPAGATTPAPNTVPAVAPAPTAGTPQPVPVEQAPAVASDTFRQQFARDADGSERKYKDRTLEITGTISSLQEVLPFRGVILGTLQDSVPPVLCDLSPDQAAAFARLKPGQKVTIRGVFLGKTAEGFLGFSKCQVVPK